LFCQVNHELSDNIKQFFYKSGIGNYPGCNLINPHHGSCYGKGAKIATAKELAIQPQCVSLLALVEVAELLGSATNLFLNVDGHKLVAKVPAQAKARRGERVTAWLNMNQAHWFHKDIGLAIN